jgi:hypothetical protein
MRSPFYPLGIKCVEHGDSLRGKHFYVIHKQGNVGHGLPICEGALNTIPSSERTEGGHYRDFTVREGRIRRGLRRRLDPSVNYRAGERVCTITEKTLEEYLALTYAAYADYIKDVVARMAETREQLLCVSTESIIRARERGQI